MLDDKTIALLDTLHVAKVDGGAEYSMLGEFEKLDLSKRKKCFGQTKRAGGLYLITSDTQPEYVGHILEAVCGITLNDFMLTLYEPSPVFNSVAHVLDLRERLIDSIESSYNAARGALAIPDPQRGRDMRLQELGTMQLRDCLMDRLEKGMSNKMNSRIIH